MIYTQKPWNIETHAGHAHGLRLVICAPDYENRVAVISVSGAPHGDGEIAQANANLIAAAPELLEVLSEIIYDVNIQDFIPYSLGKRAHEIVSRVRGEE